MKKKLLLTLLALVCVLCCTLALVACETIPVESVKLNKSSITLTIGATETLSATVTPAVATNNAVTWTSSDTDVATVDENGKVTAKAAGTATITATADGKGATCAVTVGATVSVPVESIKLNKETLTLTVGGNETLTVTYQPNNANDKTVTWTSSKSDVATVDANGKVTAKAAGTATVTAKTANGKTATCTVTVTANVAVESITLNKGTLTLTVGGNETLTVNYEPSDATDKTVTWTSSDTDVATVDTNGKVTAKAAGTATITAKTANDKSATCTATVNSADPAKVTADEWTQILNGANNYTLAYGQMTVKVAANLRAQIRGNQQQILAKESDSYFRYLFNGTKWTKTDSSASVYAQSERFATLPALFKNDYASFTYAEGKYTAASLNKTVAANVTMTDVEITFENGALKRISFNDGSNSYAITNVGTTTIPLPTDYTDQTSGGTNGLNDEQWQEALSLDAFTNVTATMTMTGDNTEYVLSVDLANKKYSYNDNSGTTYCYSIENGQCYSYSKGASDEKFERSTEETSDFEEQLRTMEQMAVMVLADKRSEFTYDASTKTYTVQNLTLGSMSYNITMRFDDNGKLVYADIDEEGEHLIVNYVYGNATVTLPTDFTLALERITLNKGETVLHVGDSETLTVTFEPNDAANKTVTWTSDNPNVATVDSNGKITAKATGIATITAMAARHISATCIVNVVNEANSVAGKTFVFSDMTSDGECEYLDEMKVANEGATIAFNEDKTVVVTTPTQSVVQNGTYVQNGATITIAITSMSMNGTVQDVDITVDYTISGNQLSTDNQYSESVVLHILFVLQTEPANSVAGKTFVFNDADINPHSDAALEQYKAAFEGSSIAFDSEGNVAWTMTNGTLQGTYTYTDSALTISFEGLTIRQSTFNGTDTVTMQMVAGGSSTEDVATLTFKLQTSEA